MGSPPGPTTSSSRTSRTPTWLDTRASGTQPFATSGALLVLTADHGNADQLRDADGSPVTAHSLNPVPILAAGAAVAGRSLRDGVLADVAPTILELAGLPAW